MDSVCLDKQKQSLCWLGGCSACLRVSPVIALAAECDNPNHTTQGEAVEGNIVE